MNAAALVEGVLARYHLKLTFDQAILIAASEAIGEPLDPQHADDAAVILHAETLLERGARVLEAITEARHAVTAERNGTTSAPARSRNGPRHRQQRPGPR